MRTQVMTQLSAHRKAVVVGVAALLVLLGLTDRAALQLAAAVATCLVLPGLGWARKLRSGDAGDTFALTLVISIASTVLISTAMAVSAHWSVAGGLAALAGVTLLGFVPYRAALARAGAVLPAPVAVDGRRASFADWYDEARREAAEQRALARRAAAEDSERWQDWYANLGTMSERPSGDGSEVDPALSAMPTEVVPPAAEPAEDADLAGLGDSWDDWYAAARRRDDVARRRAESADRQTGKEWREWYRRAANDAGVDRGEG